MRISDSKDELEHHFAKAFGRTPVPLQQKLPLQIEARLEEERKV